MATISSPPCWNTIPKFVPLHALCREILPQFGRRVECRVARFDRSTGELHLGITASCWLSFSCTTPADVERAVGVVREFVAGSIG